jgi:hypothetical protein
MNENKCFSQEISIFHGRKAPETAFLVGYGTLIDTLRLDIPIPSQLSIISKKHKRYELLEWQVFTPRHQPKETLYDQLVFGLKYEGINLLFFKKLFKKLLPIEIETLVQIEPQGQYCRKLWFLYEWLMEVKLSIPDLESGNYVPLLDAKLQYAINGGINSPRHRIINNLPGTRDFCPLIRKTPKLEQYIASDLLAQNDRTLKGIHRDILLRTSAFLMLKDSKASFTIEGESPKSKRTARWAKAIGQAGNIDLSKEELLRLQQVVIENDRFVEMGLRKTGGFVGEHDRITGEPIPDHISARWQDVEQLIDGLLSTYNLQMQSDFSAVISAASIAFGFVFIHPFDDGNGRIHRYIIHHVLAKKQFTPQGIIFPVSASILSHIDDYRKVLESYSQPLLDFIEWTETKKHNVEVQNETIDFYRYFDATKQAEFLYDCVNDTIQNIIPEEINYLMKYDAFKRYLDEDFEMPDNSVSLLINFLEQNNGKLSKRAREKEFSLLTDNEVEQIEKTYEEIMN